MSTILKALEDEGGGGGGRGEKVMSIMEGRGKGELFFTDNVLKMPNINPASRFCVSSLN